MKDLAYIGEKLRKLRENRSLTLIEVGQAIGKSPSLVGSVERADRCPSLPSLIKLANFYDIPLAYLFEDDLDKYQKEVGRKVETILAANQLAIADLANRADLNYFQLADFLQGRTNLTLDQLKKIAILINIPVKQLIPETVRYLNHIQRYLEALGLDDQSMENIIEYINSKFEP